MGYTVLFTAFCQLLAIAMGAVLSRNNSTDIPNARQLQVYKSSPLQHHTRLLSQKLPKESPLRNDTSTIRKQMHHKQRPGWIHKEVWSALHTMIITSNLPSASNESINETSVGDLQARDTADSESNPFQDAPLPDFDPFGDLHNENTSMYGALDDTLNFFELTTANVKAARAKEWYAEWSISRRNHSRWGPSGKGEWALFIAEFTGNPNFECSLGVACRNYMNLGSLVTKFPKNPELVRRIWIIENYMIDWHDFNSITDQGYERAILSITNQLPTLIASVSSSPNGGKTAFCAMAHTLVNVGAQAVILALTGPVGGIVSPYQQEGKDLFNFVQKFGQEVKPIIDGEVKGEGRAITIDFWGIMQSEIFQPLWSTTTWAQGGLSSHWGAGIDGGKGMDPMCSPFEGDLQINIDANVKKLQVVVSDELNRLHKRLGKGYRDLFHGVIPNNTKEGEMSPTARMFTNQQFSGDDSIVSKVENPDMFQADFEIMMAMKLISVMASVNHQYQKCAYDEKAQERCAKAAQQTSPCVNPTGGATKNCQRGIFCPRDTTNIICKGAAWYYAVANGHETELPHLESWEGMFSGRDDEVFRWNRNKMLQSTYDFYDLYHNNFDGYDATFGVNAENSTRGMAGLQIPVCISMQGDIADGRFPVGCGKDWRANETVGFMNRLAMGEGSQVYNDRDAGFPNDLFVNVIPDGLDHHYPQSNSPASHYVTFCQLKIRHPDHTLDKIIAHHGRKGEDLLHMHAIHMEADKSCGMVMEKTAAMTMDQADAWFCGDGMKEHGVFEREMYMTVSKPLVRTYASHKKRCSKWIKERRRKGS